ncbi:MAG TPA: phage major capsid protein [Candidatus Eisenbacteria bacterium]|nr:phage major capsid protein [Candidatus Eisenbacteria bacterium]
MSQRKEVLARAEALLKQTPFSKQNEAMVNSLLRLADALEVDETAAARSSNGNAAELCTDNTSKELREALEFSQFVNYRGQEKRTYASLSEGAAPGSYNIPSQWRREYTSKLVSASGWLTAGLTVKNTLTGKPYISFFDDDSANVASIISENSALPNANPTFNAPTANPVTFASATLLSNQLKQDVQNGSFDVDGFLQTLLGKRVGRAFNTYATSDGTVGLLAQISVEATAASTSVPTLAELTDMLGALNQAYLEADSKPVFMGSQALKIRLMKQVDGNQRRLYPELQNGMLLGLPYVVNADMTAAAGDVALVCGSVARLAIVEDVQPALIKSVERFAEYFQTLYGVVHRLGVKLVDSNACVALKLHS